MSGGPRAVGFAEALRFWLKLGFISFGGPAGQIAIMHRELVEGRRWISERRFLHALNFCMVLPGPEAQQLATYIGWLMHGTRGGIAAGGLFVLPSLVILIALSWIYVAFGSVSVIAGVLYGFKPAVTALVLSAAWRIGSRTLSNALLWAVAAAAFVAIFALEVPFPGIIAAAALTGIVAGRLKPALWTPAKGGQAAADSSEAYLIGDDTPTPPHARYAPARTLALLGAGIGIGAAGLGILAATGGWYATLAQLGWFFTKAALLTFGGAYAVLPYVFQGAVEQHHWLTAAQMMDGLALGETTPGPLIMVVAFVGFVGGWTDAARTAGISPQALALAGACVATFFTFLPSFVFILAGGPLIEATHGELRLAAPLTCITAAVVGVIVNLAVFFAWKVFWPDATANVPLGGRFDWFAVGVAAAAFVALARFRANVLWVVLACGLAGMLATQAFQ